MKVYVHKGGKQYGPFTVAHLRQYVQKGNFTTGDHACYDSRNWVTIADVPGFAQATEPAATPSPTAPRRDQAVQEKAVERQPAAADASNPTSKKKKIILWSSIGGIAALLVAAGLFFWPPGNEGDPAGDKTDTDPQKVKPDAAVSEEDTLAEFLPGKRIYFYFPESDDLGTSAEPPKTEPEGGKPDTPPEAVWQFERDGTITNGFVLDGKFFPSDNKMTYKVVGLEVSGKEGGMTFSSHTPQKGDEVLMGEKGQEKIPVRISRIEEVSPSAAPTNAKPVQAGEIDLEDPETRKKIALEAIHFLKTQRRGKDGEILVYATNEQMPYTGWVKWTGVESSFATPSSRDNRPVTALVQYKDGKKDGLDMSWYENGQKVSEMTWKGGKPTAAQIVWKPNGEKCPVTNVDKNGNGILVHYDEDGTELFRNTLKGGMEVDIQFPE